MFSQYDIWNQIKIYSGSKISDNKLVFSCRFALLDIVLRDLFSWSMNMLRMVTLDNICMGQVHNTKTVFFARGRQLSAVPRLGYSLGTGTERKRQGNVSGTFRILGDGMCFRGRRH